MTLLEITLFVLAMCIAFGYGMLCIMFRGLVKFRRGELGIEIHKVGEE